MSSSLFFFLVILFRIDTSVSLHCHGYLCNNGECTRSRHDQCDGYKDCTDESDERNCTDHSSNAGFIVGISIFLSFVCLCPLIFLIIYCCHAFFRKAFRDCQNSHPPPSQPRTINVLAESSRSQSASQPRNINVAESSRSPVVFATKKNVEEIITVSKDSCLQEEGPPAYSTLYN